MTSPEEGSLTPTQRRWLVHLGEAALVVAAFGFMLWVRLQSLEPLTRDGTVFFVGTDPYYHLRNVLVTLHHFPQVLTFDPWTYYPLGTASGQFGTLFDIVIAGVLLLVGGGSPPSMETIRTGVAIYPAVLGALTVVPVWLVARQAGGRIAGAWAAVSIAFISGEFLVRSVAGYFDHHVAEALLSTLAIAAFLWAHRVTKTHQDHLEPLWNPLPEDLDTLRTRLTEAPRRPLLHVVGASILAGLALAIYLLVWNYGILFVGILGIALLTRYLVAHHRDQPTGGTTLMATVTFLAAALVLVPFGWTEGLHLHRVSVMQPLLLVISAVGVLVLQGLRRETTRRDLPQAAYPGLAAASALAAVLVLALALPEVVGSLRSALVWVTGINAGTGVSTIAEVRATGWGGLMDQHGYLVIPALAGLAVVGWEAFRSGETTPSVLLIWGLVVTVATLNQVRFNYYMSVVVAVLAGVLMARVATWTGLADRLQRLVTGEQAKSGGSSRKRGRRTKAKARGAGTSLPMQLGTVALVGLFLLPGLVVETDARPFQAWKVSESMRPGEEAEWEPELLWLRDNTPSIPGFSITGHHDGPLEMSPERYGVLSWWDYGHWIQLTGERPPVANPFQQAAPFASEYFTNPPEESEDLLRDWEGDGFVRYIMIDDAMATGKFGAITVWAKAGHHFPSRDDPSSVKEIGFPDGEQHRVLQMTDAYRESTMYHLFELDADGLPNVRLVRESPDLRFVGSVAPIQGDGNPLCFHTMFPSARCGVVPVDEQAAFQAAARGEPFQVRTLNGNQVVGLAYNAHVTSTLDTFERVEGAVLAGEAPAGSNVTANVTLTTGSDRTFGYERTTLAGADGTYRLRVSYATGPPTGEAGRDVVSRGSYTVHVDPPDAPARALQVEVPDEAVLEGQVVDVPPYPAAG